MTFSDFLLFASERFNDFLTDTFFLTFRCYFHTDTVDKKKKKLNLKNPKMSFPGEGSANGSMQKISTIGVQTTAGALKNKHPFSILFRH